MIQRITLLFVFCGWSLVSNAQAILNDRQQNFDHNWKFLLGDPKDASATNFDDITWRDLTLPHDWSIEGEIAPNNSTGNDGGYFPAGIGWYRKSFVVPKKMEGKRVSIYFEGVYMNSEVFINGKSLGIYPYGYSSFSYDLTPHIDFGKVNVVAVKVDNNHQKNCRWYSGAGIYRHVKLFVTNRVYVDDWGLSVTTPAVSSEKATIILKTLLRNETPESQHVLLSSKIRSGKSIVGNGEQIKIELAANSSKEIAQTINVPHPLRWTPSEPHLYEAEVLITQNSRDLDKATTTFGVRSIAFSTDQGFQLNGVNVKLNGGCVHHDNGCLGAAAYDKAEVRKVKLLKSAGFNAVRTSHNPPSEAFLNACDSLGLLVIDEAFDGWRESKTPFDYARHFDQWWQRDIDAMVLRDRNHPSIIMWSIGNEIIERKKPEAVRTAKMLAERVRQLDSTRPVTSAMTTWDQDWDIFDSLFAAHDVGGYNYQLHHAVSDHQRVPSRIIVQTESYPRDAFANWKLVNDHSYIIGDFVWTAMDYLGESGIGRYYYPGELEGQHWEKNFYPWHGAYCGDIDLVGWRKPISHYRDMLYNHRDDIFLAVKEPNPTNGEIKETMWSVWPTWESWTWPGYEGKIINVEVYSQSPSVRLYHNGKLLGERETTSNQQYKASFEVPYSPGILKAVAVIDNNEIHETYLKTAGAATKIRLTADSRKLSANGQDLSFITVELIDEEGNIQPNANNVLSFKIAGPAVIAGVDNADLKDPAPYQVNVRKAWKGRALVVIKTTEKSGSITVDVSSPGLTTSTLTVKSVK